MTIAGSDCSGGAGIEADIKTMSALGCYASSVITAVTVQNTRGVRAVEAVRPDIISGQIDAVMTDINPRTIKVGMVNDVPSIRAIAAALRRYPRRPLIVDPVMVATSGDRLMQQDALSTFTRDLLPLSTLLTPNIPEASILSDIHIQTLDDMRQACRIIHDLGAEAVLVKGGHAKGAEKTDVLFFDGQFYDYSLPTVDTVNTHGTGCTLSSAIASFIARGETIPEAVGKAKQYLYDALRGAAGVRIGEGHGPVNHFFNPQKLIITE